MDSENLLKLKEILADISNVDFTDNEKHWEGTLKEEKFLLPNSQRSNCCFYFYLEGAIDLNVEHGEEELPQILASVGYLPKSEVSIHAGCNGTINHLLLAKVAQRILDKLLGCISFYGKLPVLEEQLENKKLYKIYYRLSDENNDMAYYHLADKDFLDYWITQPNFLMIK